jgi:beta-xylosidase
VIVTIAMGRGCIVFTATDPAGPWSDGTVIEGIGGIDPDLAWDEDGTAIVTFSGLMTTGEDLGTHHGVQQAKVDLEAGRALEEPRSLWSGTGLKFPEAPHLYHRGDYWYLMIAEGGTERGHGVSIARGTSPYGPFEGFEANPFLSARSTSRPIQNTGHGDLVETPDGGTSIVLLGMRPRGMTQAFSALGRETFVTRIDWVDDWPVAQPVELRPRPGVVEYDITFHDVENGGLDDGWLAIRQEPSDVAKFDVEGRLIITGDGSTLDDPRPRFLGRRQLHQTARFSTTLDTTQGTGGIAARYDEDHHYELEATTGPEATVVIARARLASIVQEWSVMLPAGPIELTIDAVPPTGGFGPGMMTSDRVLLQATADGKTVTLADVDGRYLSAETAASFTGRVVGLYATTGRVAFAGLRYRGSED